MPDIFDQLDAPSRDIFDEIGGADESPEVAEPALAQGQQLSDAAAMMKEGARESLYANRRANLFGTAAQSLDIPGAFKALINQPNRIAGLPDMPPIITPEQASKAVRFFSPVTSSEGSLARGIEEGVGQLASGLTEPENIAALALAKRFPLPIARTFQGQMIGGIPTATRQLMQAQTPEEAGRAGVGLAANVALPALIERGLTPKPITLPEDYARKNPTPAEIHGPVRPLPVESVQEVPVQESSAGIKPQAEAVPPAPEILKPAQATGILPEQAAGTVRLFTGKGGAVGGGTGESWYTQDIKRAASFGPDVSYVDVPTDVWETANERARNEGSGTGQDAVLSDEWVRKAKPVGAVEPPIHDLDAKPAELKADMETARRIVEMTPQQFKEQAASFNRINLELGANATPEQVAELKQLKAKADQRLNDALERIKKAETPEAKEAAMADLGPLSTMPQFFNEAIIQAERPRDIAYPSDTTKIAKFAGYQFGLPQWKIPGNRPGIMRDVSAETARKAGYDVEPEPAKPQTKVAQVAKPAGTPAPSESLAVSDVAFDTAPLVPENGVQPAYRPISADEAASPKLGTILTSEGRVMGQPESATRRLTAIRDNKTGQVHLVSTYRTGDGVVRMVDPAKAGQSKPNVAIGTLLPRYTVLDSILRKEPVRNFIRTFENEAAYREQVAGPLETEHANLTRGVEAGAPKLTESLPAETLSPEGPITSGEVNALYNHFAAEEIASPKDIESAFNALLTGKSPNMRQISFALVKMADAVKQRNPALSPEGAIARVLEEFYEKLGPQGTAQRRIDFSRETLAAYGEKSSETPPQAGPAAPPVQSINRMRPVPPGQGEEIQPPSLAEIETQRRLEQVPPTGQGSQALGITPLGPLVKVAGQKLISFRNKLVNSWASRGTKSDIARAKDAADTQAKVYANQQGRSVLLDAQRLFGKRSAEALRAVTPTIESGGDRTKLAQFIAQSTGKHLEATRAAQFADANWLPMQVLAEKVKKIQNVQILEENAAGIATEYRENYIRHAFDVEKLPNRGEEFFGAAGGTGSGKFRAARKFTTLYDAIEAGYGDAIKSLNASKLVESRLAAGQQMINDRAWVGAFRQAVDPTTGKPIITNAIVDRNGIHLAPAGYEAVPVLPGQFVAVHNGYKSIFAAIMGESRVATGEVAGLPVGKAALNTVAAIKHGLLLFDTFHASRIMQKQFFLTGKVGWNKGVSLLEYADSDLAEAVRQGEITQEMADYARTNRPTARLLMKNGLNVGRIQEALRNEIVRNLPVIGTFNRWVFDKVTRGAMMQSALLEYERIKAQQPSLTDSQAAGLVAKKINVTFGNIGRQGLFRSRTMQDISRLVGLAPQWVESMARAEIGGWKELGQVPVDVAMGKGLQIGTLGKTMAGGLLAYLVGTQLLNLATHGKPTWQNEEEGHKLDAWIPDVTGKTPGFFLNPLSVVAELTHDAVRYAFKKDNAFEIGKQIAQNKAGPLSRSVGVLWSGKNFQGEKITSSWNRIKEAAVTLAPTPIPLSGLRGARPGQTQRQLTASLGVKTEPAETKLQRIADKAREFARVQGWEKKGMEFMPTEDPSYLQLRKKVRAGDTEGAQQIIAALRGEEPTAKRDQQIEKAMRDQSKRPFTGSKEHENAFKASLSEKDSELYDAAREEQQQLLEKFLDLWQDRP